MMTTSWAEREEWRDIPGYEGRYEVSSLGNIRSLDGVVECVTQKTGTVWHKRVKGRIKKPTIAKNGYYVVTLGHGNLRYVHELVALAFFGERPARAYICHGDGNPKNNTVDNLRYDTPAENNRDKLRYGGTMKKLKMDDVLAIRAAAETGEPWKALAKRFNVSSTMIGYIVKRRCFTWI